MTEQTIETLEIAELEYDVAGAGALEPTDAQTSNAAYLFFSVVVPG